MSIMTLPELARLARTVRQEAGLTQADVAARLSGDRKVAQSHVSQAEQGAPKYASLAARIVEGIGGMTVEPVYRVRPHESHFTDEHD
jgi:transcriptional regulator with XRE-family HTH domain